jgi:hypothetical protein
MKPVETAHAHVLNKLEQIKLETLSQGFWSTLTSVSDLILGQERTIESMLKITKEQSRILSRSGPTYKATYNGPLTLLRGKTALLRDITVAQFDDRGQYLAYGWHNVKKEDFRVEEKAPLFQTLAMMCDARRNCFERIGTAHIGAQEWFDKWTERAEALVKEHMPSGSGFDAGTTLDLDESSGAKLVFNTSYHHMGQHGGYDGWTEHQVIVTPSLSMGFNLRVTGRNKNDVRDYISDVFGAAMNTEVNKYGG